jgi:ADP-ribosylglycohydrolase
MDDILNKVKTTNASSQSNGSLMRIAPMAIFFTSIKEDPTKHENFIKSNSYKN